MIDWRQDFAGLEQVGDRYYDLAKFLHTLDLSVEAMDAGAFRSDWGSAAEVVISHDEHPGQATSREAFWRFAAGAGYDPARISLLNGVIFINMAPLYEAPMSDYLYLLGRLRLAEALGGQG